jgi:hypothetical protein
MSSELLAGCHCRTCCKCHQAVGGPSSVFVEWTGAASIAPASCCAWELTCTGSSCTGAVFAMVGAAAKSISSHSYVATWNAPLNQSDCRLVDGNKSDGNATYDEYEYSCTETPPGSGTTVLSCVGVSAAGVVLAPAFSVNIKVLPPTWLPCGGCSGVLNWSYPRNWTVIVTVPGLVRWTFTSDSNLCNEYGTFALTLTENLYTPTAGAGCTGGCDAIFWGAGAWQLGTLNAGSVSIS